MLLSIKLHIKRSGGICLSPPGVELQKLSSLKYYNVQKRESRLTLGIDAVKNTHISKNASNKSC